MGQNSIRDHNSGSPGRTGQLVRLDSWKEIASYLHRDARTVRRWERERRLPVHRVPGGERSGVFAYVSELEHWLRSTVDPSAPAEPALPLAPSTAASELVLVSKTSSSQGAQPHHNEAQTQIARPGVVAEVPPTTLVTPVTTERRRSSDLASPPPSDPDIHSAILEAESSRWAFHAMVLVLICSIAAGSTFAFVHYRRFHRANAQSAHPSPEAQELYLRGRYSWNLRTEQGLNQAVDLFTQAIVNDPHYAPAYAGLADSYLLLRQYGHMSDAEAYPRALAAARQALALDVNSPDPHRSLAFILCFWNWDMPAAEQEYLRAIALDPKNSQSHHWYATALLSAGRYKDAMAQIDLARMQEPQSASVLADRGLILSFEDPEQAIEQLKQVTLSQPAFLSAHSYLSRTYLGLGNYSEFLAEDRIVAQLAHEDARTLILDQARKDLNALGPQQMVRNLASAYGRLTELGQMSAYTTARLFGLSGDTAQTIYFLQLARDRRDPGFLSIAGDGAFHHLRLSPEYIALVARKDSVRDIRREPIAQLDRKSLF